MTDKKAPTNADSKPDIFEGLRHRLIKPEDIHEPDDIFRGLRHIRVPDPEKK
jgi:hypothetical protein